MRTQVVALLSPLLCLVLGKPRPQRRAGLTPLSSSPAQLQDTLDSFRELQAELSRSVLALDAEEERESLTYEIKPLQPATPPPPALLRPREARRRGGARRHRLRHPHSHAKHQRSDLGFRVNANVHPGGQGFRRSSSPNSFTGFLHPKKGCPSVGGRQRLQCPSRSSAGYHVCLSLEELCDGRPQCPDGEDESPLNCLFYRTTMGHFKRVVDAVVSLTDHIVHQEDRHREL